MKTVALIIGHSQESQGAANANGMTEWKYNTELVAAIADQLRKCGSVKPIIVERDTYADLPDKVNATGADIAVSFHANAFNTEVSGSEVLYYHRSIAGKQLAQDIQQAAIVTLGLTDRGIKPKDESDRGGHMLRHTTMPCVIVEPFFIDNDSDLTIGFRKQNALAVRYARAIEGYFR